MERRLTTEAVIKRYLNASRKNEHYLLVGNGGLTDRTASLKLLCRTNARKWPDLDGVVESRNPGEAARIELEREFGKTGRNGWNKASLKYFDVAPPFFVRRLGYGEGVYIDITACYWQLYRKLSLDIKFPRLQGQKALLPVADRLSDWKQARNALVGISISRWVQARKGVRIWRVSTRNSFLTPYLWAHIQAMLHELAAIAIDFDSVYCCTDGFIFPSVALGEAFSYKLLTYGIRHTYKAGQFDVRGLGSWSFEGVRETELYKRGIEGTDGIKNVVSIHPLESDYFVKWWSELEPKGVFRDDNRRVISNVRR